MATTEAQSQVHVPRIAIKFCTQCKWNLRAAYYAQELLQTFSTSLGEVSLIPVTGGIFTVTISHTDSTSASSTSTSESKSSSSDPSSKVTETLLWDRKAEGGFPETKELKNRVRNVIEPGRDLGHIDRSLKKGKGVKDGEGGEAPSVVAATSSEAGTPETTEGIKKGDDGSIKSKSNGGDGDGDVQSTHSKAKEDCEDCK